ncbi:MAG: MarR family transcriptional regulator [Desulfovibrionaceae bacterium]|nr:MarR family transcriptional regulator [Desulfovibrionaceae bacterium]
MDRFRNNPALAPNVISRIHQLSEEFLKSELEKAGLTGMVASHGHILGCLFMEDKLPMGRIVSLIKRRKSTLTVLADKLEQEGYIRREASPADSRVRHLALTPRAEAVRPVFMDIARRLQERFWNGFSPEEQRRFMDYLLRMENNFRPDAGEEPADGEPGQTSSAGQPRS